MSYVPYCFITTFVFLLLIFFFLLLFCSVRSNEIPAEVVNLLVFLEDFLIYSQLPRKVCWILFLYLT